MPDSKTDGKGWLKSITTAGGVAASIAAVIGMWLTLDTRIADSDNKTKTEVIAEIQASTALITKEIYTNDYRIVESIRDMMNIRIRVKEIEIQRLRNANKPVSDADLLELAAIKDMLEELDRKWRINQQ